MESLRLGQKLLARDMKQSCEDHCTMLTQRGGGGGERGGGGGGHVLHESLAGVCPAGVHTACFSCASVEVLCASAASSDKVSS